VDCPQNATILGAAKVTGRLASGMSLGALAAVTSRESARIYDSTTNTFSRIELVPPAGYGVMRVQQELGASKSVIGVTLTTVHRGVDSLLAPRYTKHAYAGGADWVFCAGIGEPTSCVAGPASVICAADTADINRVQRSPVHYFQRPDAGYLTYDPARTTLTGRSRVSGSGRRRATGCTISNTPGNLRRTIPTTPAASECRWSDRIRGTDLSPDETRGVVSELRRECQRGDRI